MANVASIIETIGGVIRIASQALQAGMDVAPFAQAIYNTFAGKKDVTQEELDALIAQCEALSNELQAPLPDDEAGT